MKVVAIIISIIIIITIVIMIIIIMAITICQLIVGQSPTRRTYILDL